MPTPDLVYSRARAAWVPRAWTAGDDDRDQLLTVAQVKKLCGDRFERVCANGRCSPVRHDGERMYFRSCVLKGLRRDREQYPGTGPAVVRKSASRGLSPEVGRRLDRLLDRLGQFVVVRKGLGRDGARSRPSYKALASLHEHLAAVGPWAEETAKTLDHPKAVAALKKLHKDHVAPALAAVRAALADLYPDVDDEDEDARAARPGGSA
jgi:hypothetical protein